MPRSQARITCLFCLSLCLILSAAYAADANPLDFGAAGEPGRANFFGKIPSGPQAFDGIPFEFRDTMVRVQPGKQQRIDFPPTLAAGIHFLHFTEQAGSMIGAYTLVYADGTRVEVPLQGGINIQDWWLAGPLPFAAQVYTDAFPASPEKEQKIGFWRFSVRNPHPDTPLATIEITNSDAMVTINLIAVSLTETCEENIGAVPVWVVGMDEEQFLLAVLNQEGSTGDKVMACAQLAKVGTLKSVPALARWLADEQVSHAARLALASMAYPEAHDALRDALPASTGTVKTGIIESLGALRNPEYAALVAPSVSDADPVIALSATLALGRIATPDSIAPLKNAARNATGRLQAAAVDSLLLCARVLNESDTAAAFSLYKEIFELQPSGYLGTAAYSGMITSGGPEAVTLIASALTGSDPVLWEAALPAVREMKDPAITTECCRLLPQLPPALLPGLLGALAQRGDRAAAPAIAPFVNTADATVSTAALDALTLIGDGSSVPALVAAAARGVEPDAAKAAQALLQIPGPDVSTALLESLKSAGATETAVIAKVLGQRRDASVAPVLRELVQNPDAGIRAAAAQALGEIGDATDVEVLCLAASKAEDEKQRLAVQQALVSLGMRLETPENYIAGILAGLSQEDTALRCLLFNVCGQIGHAALLEALNKATGTANEVEKAAAIRALAASESPDALPLMLALPGTALDPAGRAVVFRGIARLASNQELKLSDREVSLTAALALAGRPEEKRLLLGALGSCRTLGALKAAEALLDATDVQVEAAVAWGQIASALVAEHRDAISAVIPKALAVAEAAGLTKATLQPLLDVNKALAAVPVPGSAVSFEKVVIDREFRSEGVAVADVNRDGRSDILVGDIWYEAPDWKVREIRPPEKYDAANGYSRCFAAFAEDVDKDGWPDVLVVGFPGAPAYWYRNPGTGEGHWQEYLLATEACGETPLYADLTGDGKPEPIFAMNGRITWFRPGQDETMPWLAYPMSHMLEAFAKFGHGLGVGDVNGDGRPDVLTTELWWEGPVDYTRPDWGFHRAKLGPDCADMIVYDVNGDGHNDVLTSSAHEYGVWWFEQTPGQGDSPFVQHEIDKSISETHALILADLNNDGLQDLVTGKRYFAHGEHDPGALEPSLLCWYELQRPEAGKVSYVKHVIDEDSGVGTQFNVLDFNEDGLLDIITSNKKGVSVFLQKRGN